MSIRSRRRFRSSATPLDKRFLKQLLKNSKIANAQVNANIKRSVTFIKNYRQYIITESLENCNKERERTIQYLKHTLEKPDDESNLFSQDLTGMDVSKITRTLETLYQHIQKLAMLKIEIRLLSTLFSLLLNETVSVVYAMEKLWKTQIEHLISDKKLSKVYKNIEAQPIIIKQFEALLQMYLKVPKSLNLTDVIVNMDEIRNLLKDSLLSKDPTKLNTAKLMRLIRADRRSGIVAISRYIERYNIETGSDIITLYGRKLNYLDKHYYEPLFNDVLNQKNLYKSFPYDNNKKQK